MVRHHGSERHEVLDVVLTTAARCFFSTVLDATGALADAALIERIDDLRRALPCGRAIADHRPLHGGGDASGEAGPTDVVAPRQAGVTRALQTHTAC